MADEGACSYYYTAPTCDALQNCYYVDASKAAHSSSTVGCHRIDDGEITNQFNLAVKYFHNNITKTISNDEEFQSIRDNSPYVYSRIVQNLNSTEIDRLGGEADHDKLQNALRTAYTTKYGTQIDAAVPTTAVTTSTAATTTTTPTTGTSVTTKDTKALNVLSLGCGSHHESGSCTIAGCTWKEYPLYPSQGTCLMFSTGAQLGSNITTGVSTSLFTKEGKVTSCDGLSDNSATDKACSDAVFVSADTATCPPNEPLCAYYKNKYDVCHTAIPSADCTTKACVWVAGSDTQMTCAPKDAIPFPLPGISTSENIKNYSFDTIDLTLTDSQKNTPAEFVPTKNTTAIDLLKLFFDDVENKDFYLSKLDICDFTNKPSTATCTNLVVKPATLTASVVAEPCVNIENKEDLYATIANNGSTIKGCYVYGVKTRSTNTDTLYIYDDESLGFKPYTGYSSDTKTPSVWTSSAVPGKRGSNFCTTKVDKHFSITPEALTAWALISEDDSFYSKGNLKIEDKYFPSSGPQFASITTGCNGQEKIVKMWVDSENLIVGSYLGGNNPAVIQSSAIYKVACGAPSGISSTVPKVYRDTLIARNENIKTFCTSTTTQAKPTGAFAVFKDFILRSAVAAKSTNVGGSEILNAYLLKVNSLSKLSSPAKTSKTAKNAIKTAKQEAKTAKNGVCTDPKNWWKSFKCSIDSTAIGGLGVAAAKWFTVWSDYQDWKQNLALTKQQFEEGACYPYKADHDKATTAYCTASPTASECIKIPYSIAGVTKQYDMYQFCRLTASGALAFMDTCGALVANKAPQTAIDACYGVQARTTGTFAPMYTNGNTAAVAAANNNNAAAANNNNAAAAATSAASPTTAGAAAGTAAKADADKDKKAKSPYDSVYSTPYSYPTSSKGFQERGYQYPYEAGSSNSTNVAASKTAKVTKEAPGSTIGNLVTGHENTIKSNIVDVKK